MIVPATPPLPDAKLPKSSRQAQIDKLVQFVDVDDSEHFDEWRRPSSESHRRLSMTFTNKFRVKLACLLILSPSGADPRVTVRRR